MLSVEKHGLVERIHLDYTQEDHMSEVFNKGLLPFHVSGILVLPSVFFLLGTCKAFQKLFNRSFPHFPS